jgi:hypothetical protein
LFDGINCGLLGLPRAVLPLDVWCIQTIETIDLYVKMSSSLKLIMQEGLLTRCMFRPTIIYTLKFIRWSFKLGRQTREYLKKKDALVSW